MSYTVREVYWSVGGSGRHQGSFHRSYILRTSFMHQGNPIPYSKIPKRHQECIINLVVKAYHDHYRVNLHIGMAFKLQHWGLSSGMKTFGNCKCYPVLVGDFLSLRRDSSDCFYWLRNVVSVSIGTLVKVFFGLSKLRQEVSQEIAAPPYMVFCEEVEDAIEFVGVSRIDGAFIHFVYKQERTWWHNPYVVDFL